MTSDHSRSAKQSIGPNLKSPGHRQTVPTSTQDVSQASKKQPYPLYPPSSLVAAPEGGRGTEHTLSQGMGRLTISTQPHNNPTINVVLFGEPGVGKSAVVNLIARKNVVRVLSGVHGCTMQSTRYDIPIDNTNFCVFETVGLEEPEIRGDGYLAALEKAYEFVHKLGAAGGVHLLLFCMRATRLTATTQSNYRLFTEVVVPTKVPIALVVTGLEREVEMEDWWTKNKTPVERYGLRSDGHVCITTVTDRTPHQDRNYSESQKRIRELLKSCCLKTTSPFLPEPNDWFVRLGNGMQEFIEKYRKPTRGDIMNVLATRLKVDPKTIQGFVDMMDRGDAQPSNSDGAGILERGGEAPKSNTTPKSRDLNAGKLSDEPLSKKATGGVGMAQSRYLNAEGEEDTNGKWEDEVRKRAMTAGKVKAEPRKVNTPMETYVKSEMGVSMEDIRSTFPHDLTGHVARPDRNPVASGSYGDIYRGKLSMNGKSIDVAIKAYRMYLQLDANLPERMKRFHREIIVWVRLQHPNVLPLFGTIRETNVHYDIPAMVCPWVEHGALSGYLERNKGLTVTKRLILVNDVAHGLQYLHSQHVVHGDLSGSNVLVRADGGAYIADFGLSTLLTAVVGPTFVTSRQDKGTVRWMAPELLDPDIPHTTPTTRSDVYSFGSIMLQILTGNIPYHRLSRDEQVIAAIMRGTRPDRSDQRAVTSSRWKFIERCWSANGPRPSSDEIVELTRRELTESNSSQSLV